MKSFLLTLFLPVALLGYGQSDPFSLKVLFDGKTVGDSLYFKLIDQQRVLQNDGIVQLEIFHSPSGLQERKMAWLAAGTCQQAAVFAGIANGKLFIRASTTFNGTTNSQSEFLVFVQEGKVISVHHLAENPKEMHGWKGESGTLLEGFLNKILIGSIDTSLGKSTNSQVKILDSSKTPLTQFVVAGKRFMDIFIEPNQPYFLSNASSEIFAALKGSRVGYQIRCQQDKDSLALAIGRGRDQPIENLYLLIQSGNDFDTIARFRFADSSYVLNTKLFWPKSSFQYLAFVLKNNNNQVLARRYWEPDDQLLYVEPYFTAFKQESIWIDSSYALNFSCKGCDREKITFQVTDAQNNLSNLGAIEWTSDSTFAVPNLQLWGKGHLAFQMDRNNINWKPIIKNIPATIKKPAPIFYQNAKNAISNDTAIVFKTKANTDILPEALVTGYKKTRLEELEEKYVSNIMFTSIFSVNINVIDDENSRNGMSLFDYVLLKIPIISICKNMNSPRGMPPQRRLCYRGFQLKYFIDEVPIEGDYAPDLFNNINASDVAYVKLIKNSTRVFGGELLVYTRKGNDPELDKRFKQRFPIEGIHILEK